MFSTVIVTFSSVLLFIIVFMFWYLAEAEEKASSSEAEVISAIDDIVDLDSLVTDDIIIEEEVFKETEATQFQYKNCYELGVSQADVGLIVPFEAETSLFSFRPFILVSESLKERTVEALQIEFGNKMTREFIENKWTAGNVFYVLSFKSGDEHDAFIGCVGVDRLQFYPFISNLVVHEKHRRKKFGQLLLRLAERYAERFQFPSVKLWCAEKLVPYYLKQGYAKETYEEEQQVFILSKPFERKRLSQSDTRSS